MKYFNERTTYEKYMLLFGGKIKSLQNLICTVMKYFTFKLANKT